MTIIEKHRTEYKLIEQAMNELTQMMQNIGVLEAAAEEHRIDAEQMRKNEMINRKVIEQLEEKLAQEKGKNETLSVDLGRVTAERNQLEAEIKEMEGNVERLMALHVAETEKLKNELTRETDERKNAVELLRRSFTQMQDLMNSVQSVMMPQGSRE
jgi:chromosome segregation ATPase